MKKNRQTTVKSGLLMLAIYFTSFSVMHAQNYTINTVIGNGVGGFAGDGGPATAAEINSPYGIYVDTSGSIYIPDGMNQRVRIVNSGGVINTFAGNGTANFFGDGGQATAAELHSPSSVTSDAAGNIYITDGSNDRVRMVNTAGVITTVAGNGVSGFSGDGGQATAAQISFSAGMCSDASGNLYIADLSNQRVRKISSTGIITTIAGTGTSGYNGDNIAATAAELSGPFGVAVDGTGNVYIADQDNHRIREINLAGIISTIAGNGTGSFSGDGGPATAAELNRPFAVSLDPAGNVYIADFANERIRRVNTSGTISTIAGDGTAGFLGDGGPATAAELSGPTGISIDKNGNIFITDQANNRIRELVTNCTLTATTGSVPVSSGCNGKAWVTPSGGTPPYTYSWSPGGATTDTIKSLCDTTYCCTIIDNMGCNQIYCVTVTGSTGIALNNNSSSVTRIFPSPNAGLFTIDGLTKGQMVEIYNYTGQKITGAEADNATMQFNISDKANGVYLVRIVSKDGKTILQSKVLKMN